MAARKLKAEGLSVQVERKALLEALEPAAAAVGRSVTVPILSHVRLRATGGRLVLTGTDMDLQVDAECSAMVEGEGAVCCDAQLLVAAVKAAGSEVRVVLDGERLAVSGEECRAKLATLPADEFPTFDRQGGAFAEAVWPGDLLQRLLGRVRPAISVEETRYYLCGAHLALGPGGAVLQATDGHRLVRVAARPDGLDGAQQGILPLRAVEAARKLPDSVTLTLWPGQARLSAGPVTLTTRLIDGTFPETDRVIPAQLGRHRARLGRDKLRDAVRRVAWAAGDGKAKVVEAELDRGVLRLRGRDAAGTAEAETELAAETDGGPLKVRFNARYLADALASSVGGEVTLSGENAAAPWRLDADEPSDDRIVVMPMRV